MTSLSRSLGILYGQFIGDALGSRYEFMKGKDVKAKIEKDRCNSPLVPLLGEGPFGYGPGVVTDDGEMAMSLLSTCLHLDSIDSASIACSYVRWAQTRPPDIGNTCRSALTLMNNPMEIRRIPSDWSTKLNKEEKASIRRGVHENVRMYNANSLSNGSLMRQSVLVPFVFSMKNTNKEEILIQSIEDDTLHTHCNSVAIEASKVYARILFNLVNEMSPEDSVNSVLSTVSSPILRSLIESARVKPIPVNTPDGQISNGDNTHVGYLGVSLQVAIYYLLHATSFSSGLIDVISIGGDTDTNGCIAGALLGARFGVDAIPLEWRKSVEKAPLRMKGENGIETFEQLIDGVVRSTSSSTKMTTFKMDDIVKLNVGGQRFDTRLRTLLSDRSNELFTHFVVLLEGDLTEAKMPSRDSDGNFFIDRDPEHFRTLLNNLRFYSQIQGKQKVANGTNGVIFDQVKVLDSKKN